MIISHPSISYRWSSVNHRSATGNHPAPTTGDTEILEEALVKQANPRTDQWFVSARGRTRAPARAHYARARDNARAHARGRDVGSIRGGTQLGWFPPGTGSAQAISKGRINECHSCTYRYLLRGAQTRGTKIRGLIMIDA